MIKTTVSIMDTTLNDIKGLKVHPNQSNEEIISQLIKFYKGTSVSTDKIKWVR